MSVHGSFENYDENHTLNLNTPLDGTRLTKIPNDVFNLTHLKKLVLTNNRITEIPSQIGNLINLEFLHLDNNIILELPDELFNLTNLTALTLQSNKIIEISPKIEKLINLQSLDLAGNELRGLPETIGNLINLKTIDLSRNNIESIPESIGKLVNLQNLRLIYGRLKTLPREIGNLKHLKLLILTSNQITSLPETFYKLQHLTFLDLTNNRISAISAEICNMQSLSFVSFAGNPIEYYPPQVVRLLERTGISQFGRRTIYNDSQSVHNSHIQKDVKKSIIKLSNILPDEFNLVEEIISSSLAEKTKEVLLEYMSDKTVHSTLDLTFEDVLKFVWNKIRSNENKIELSKILDVEISDSFCQCFTGRISRLVNVLNGFCPEVEINISDAEQIANLVEITRNKIVPYDSEKHRQLLTDSLKERGYSDETISNWVEYL